MAQFKRIAVVGAGLIGGSILLAAARRSLAGSLACWSRSEPSRATLSRFGVAEVFADPAECVRGADLVVVTTPVDTAEETFRAVSPGLTPGAVVTDAGSVKTAIQLAARRLPAANPFIGAHPMAGGEKAGSVHAHADLFEGRVCFLTPTGAESPEALVAVRLFWQSLGAVLHETDAAKHDEIVAAISHVPHAAASALMLAVMDQPGFRRFAVGAGLRDSTRVAAGEENLWVGIMLANARHTATGLRAVERRAAELRAAVEANDAPTLSRLLAEARVARQALDRNA
ncbi:MAG: prephenate dehydrogenase [Opitutia bacterium]|nr:MAG: prephenate dehydrogenase [Opitutae bacterium]